ncbi:SufE family protein [Gallaecimonas kandeliae]|uniref:SufE family protein n=1 Tax=Gallaecimonas kandeliae TaxID=3029055 RepID=UPI0026493587|nr:SufE family protein [Gallaecimonas kandeliae]WKE64820.1 SufE family protein [Gallaecimonas kandeliae]
MSLFDDFAAEKHFEGRTRFLLGLARSLPRLDDKHPEDEVSGCEARTWLRVDVADGKLALRGDSEARIVKGLMALLFSLYQGQALADARHVDARAEFEQVGLEQFLSPSRANGLYAMLAKIHGELG